MRRVTFLRSGRSTGLSSRTTACTGTSTKRQVPLFKTRPLLFHPQVITFRVKTPPNVFLFPARSFSPISSLFSLVVFKCLLLLRMRRRRVSSVSRSLRSTGPVNVARSSECLMRSRRRTFAVFVSTCGFYVAVMNKRWPAKNNSPLLPSLLSSAFKACHPKVKSFYFAADGVDDMNR